MTEPEISYEEVIRLLFPDNAEISQTGRYFALTNFVDRFGSKCSLQESSAADEASIWFGVDELKIQHFKAGQGWDEIKFPPNTTEEHWVDNARMHLSQDMVRKLLPTLIRFAMTGYIR